MTDLWARDIAVKLSIDPAPTMYCVCQKDVGEAVSWAWHQEIGSKVTQGLDSPYKYLVF